MLRRVRHLGFKLLRSKSLKNKTFTSDHFCMFSINVALFACVGVSVLCFCKYFVFPSICTLQARQSKGGEW